MIRNTECNADGDELTAEIIDVAKGTYTREEYGVVVLVRDLTADEIAAYTPTVDPRAELIGALKADAQAATTIAKLKAVVIAALDAGEL